MLDALRIVLALAAVELFWVATSWPDAPTMIIFTAIGVILFARQSDAAYSSALEFAVGCALAAILAAVLLLAILPSIHGGFFCAFDRIGADAAAAGSAYRPDPGTRPCSSPR